MRIVERTLSVHKGYGDSAFSQILRKVRGSNEGPGAFNNDEKLLRLVITSVSKNHYNCDVTLLLTEGKCLTSSSTSFWAPRIYENTENFNIVFIIPTGIGCELGGHSGDAGAVAILLASLCDNLITHPNVVNAADINEMPSNVLYVEGSILTRMMMGAITLQKVRSNRVLVVIDEHEDAMFHELAINSVSAAGVSLGLNCPRIVIMQDRIEMCAQFTEDGRAAGSVEQLEKLFVVLDRYRDEYDAVAISTLIDVPLEYHAEYFKHDTVLEVNPWGGIEAMLTHAISSVYNIPSAHSPMMTSQDVMNVNVGIVDPRKAAEVVSTTYLHCILKGLHCAPKILTSVQSGPGLLSINDVSCLVIPDGCVGLPVLSALKNDIPIIAVKDNSVRPKVELDTFAFSNSRIHYADNYIDAVGIIAALRAGVSLNAIKRPLEVTQVTLQEKGG